MIDVSRQAVSKWEQGDGYPEVEKLLLLSSILNISLDYLMSTEFAQKSSNDQRREDGLITITSPKYALFGANNGIDIFGGESRTF